MSDKKVDNRSAAQIVADSWGSVINGFKKRGANKAQSHFSDTEGPMMVSELRAVWQADGNGARVIKCVADDMTREGFTIMGDVSNVNASELVRLNLKAVLKKAIEYTRLYGGSAILMSIDDGKSEVSPVSVNSIKGIRYLKAIPAPNIRGVDNDIDKDRNSEFYGTFRLYQVRDEITDKPYNVHRDRLLIIPNLNKDITYMNRAGYTTPEIDSRIWGFSEFEQMRVQVSNLSLFGMALSNLSQEAVVGKYRLAGLAEMLASDKAERIFNRIDIINEAKSVINAVLLDADSNEDYVRDSLNFNGINGVADTLMIFLSGVSGIPVTRLFGRSPSGLDASGESDLKIYYDMVRAQQESMLTSHIQRLVFYVNQYKKSIYIDPVEEVLRRALTPEAETESIQKVAPRTAADINIEWKPLYQMSQKDQAQAYFTNAQADMQYINMGVLDRAEVRTNRFVNGYNQIISVDTTALPETEEEIEEEPDTDKDPKDEKKPSKKEKEADE